MKKIKLSKLNLNKITVSHLNDVNGGAGGGEVITFRPSIQSCGPHAPTWKKGCKDCNKPSVAGGCG